MMSEPEWRSHPATTTRATTATHLQSQHQQPQQAGANGLSCHSSPARAPPSASSRHAHFPSSFQALATKFSGSVPMRKTSCGNKMDAPQADPDPYASKENQQQQQRTDMLDSTTGSSSTASNSGIEYKRRHRCTLPSITTTTTTTTDTTSTSTDDTAAHNPAADSLLLTAGGGGGGGGIDYHYLYAVGDPSGGDQQQEEEKDVCLSALPTSSSAAGDGKVMMLRAVPQHHNAVRRVASFTFSPEGGADKLNKRGSVSGPTAPGGIARKLTLGPIGKTINFIKTKVDSAISTSVLYPSREECRHWQDSFEALLNHKYGCLLFRQFVKLEFSDENLQFWMDCNEFKKMKEGKKATLQKAQAIYATYVKDGAPKEVNLDSATKAATKAALESGIRPDMFNLAQAKIEQLMSKDSYQRFLKSEQYLEVLHSDRPNSDTVGGALESNRSELEVMGLLRTGSAKGPSSPSSPSSSASPSASSSPSGRKAGGSRRHTCVPDPQVNYPAIAE